MDLPGKVKLEIIMSDTNKVITERILSLSVDEQQRLVYLFNQKEKESRRARSQKKKKRCLGDMNALFQEFCLDVVAVDKSLP